MNLKNYSFEILYEINFDEEAETINGTLKINFETIEEISKELENSIYTSIDKLKLK